MMYRIGDKVKIRPGGGIAGTVIRVSPTRRWSVLVEFPGGQVRSFAPDEVEKVQPPPSIVGVPVPQPGGTP